MNESLFKGLLWLLASGFAAVFAVVVMPPLLDNPDILGAALAGFVNPYAAGYATDTIMCWCVLAVWVLYEARATGIKYGWIALVLGVVPGVATGFAIYLLIRLNQQPERV